MFLNSGKNVSADNKFGKTYGEIIAVVCHAKKQVIVSEYKFSVTSSKHRGMIKRFYINNLPDYELVSIMPNGSINNSAEKLSIEGL